MNFVFKCPVCGEKLNITGKTLKCVNNHSFDIAKQGYVNLLQSQQSSKKRHGDDKLMVQARKEFLNKGYYAPLKDELIKQISELAPLKATVADIGCGECYYTSEIYDELKRQDRDACVCGIDISKDALIAGLKRCHELNLAVGSVSALPFLDASCDIALSVFAPHNSAEIYRILNKGGIWIQVIPLEEHLMGLKSVIYEKPYKNEVDYSIPDGFALSKETKVEYTVNIDNNSDIVNLFKMTPYYYKTGESDQKKIYDKDCLETIAQFMIRIFIKIDR